MDKHALNEALEKLADNPARSASELARSCLRMVAETALHAPAEDLETLQTLLAAQAHQMIEAHPSSAPLGYFLKRWTNRVAELSQDGLEEARCKAAEYALVLVHESSSAVRAVASRAREIIGEGRVVITHGLSSTVMEIFHQLKESRVRAIVTESRPSLSGHQLAAQLSAWAIPTTLITDAQIGLFVRRADFALVGAEALLGDGSVVNSVGTYLLGVAARDQDVPFYACCESYKWRPADSEEFALPALDEAQLNSPQLPHVTPVNIGFDITPARLVTGWITEHGIPRSFLDVSARRR